MRRYWTYQVLGWLAYSVIGIAINLLAGAKLLPLAVGHVVLVSASILMTHLFRRQIQLRRTGGRAWPFLAGGVIAISAVQTLLVIGTNRVISGGEWTVLAAAALWWGMVLATGVWTILYVRFTERRGHIVREGQLQLAAKEAELRALEAQVNPHFLFNCLNSIRALVAIDPPRAQDMLTRLANVLRSSLRQNREHTVRLAEEVEVVADYIALETVRFEERLRSEIFVDPAAQCCLVPPMLLQTLVENAIKHGISQVSGDGKLCIRGERENGFVRLVVENTGRLNERTASSTKLGLGNVRERLRLLYGDDASLSLDDAGGMVRASVLIPASGQL